MKIYLDNCCYNRPFDNQKHIVIRLETEAKLFIQDQIRQRNIDLVWSFVLDYENNSNPFTYASEKIREWKELSIADIDPSEDITRMTQGDDAERIAS